MEKERQKDRLSRTRHAGRPSIIPAGMFGSELGGDVTKSFKFDQLGASGSFFHIIRRQELEERLKDSNYDIL